MFKLFLIAACVATAMATSIPFDMCEHPDNADEFLPAPVSFAIPECPGYPCDIGVGQKITLLIGIYVEEAVTALPVSATVSIDGYSFIFPLPTGNACEAIATGCPTVPGYYMIEFATPLTGVDAGTTTTVKVNITNQDKKPVACGSVTTTFVDN